MVMPICNEDGGRVIEGLRAIYESLRRAGKLPHCDFFLLSDSSDPNRWIEEEAAWLALTRGLQAQGRIFYRKRRGGINKKAGNLADFCPRWGSDYRYMVVLDADSIMSGDAIVRLAQLMERNRPCGPHSRRAGLGQRRHRPRAAATIREPALRGHLCDGVELLATRRGELSGP